MQNLILVFVGGGIGSIVRFAMNRWVSSLHALNFPVGTLVVNFIACALLGYFVGLADHKQMLSASARLFWVAGFCGGFSTFSAFTLETLALFQGGFTISALGYIGLSVTLCLGSMLGGLYAGGAYS